MSSKYWVSRNLWYFCALCWGVRSFVICDVVVRSMISSVLCLASGVLLYFGPGFTRLAWQALCFGACVDHTAGLGMFLVYFDGWLVEVLGVVVGVRGGVLQSGIEGRETGGLTG